MSVITPFSEAINFLKNKTRVPTKRFDEIYGKAHDRQFMVAGAQKDALLLDLHQAVTAAVEKGETLKMFGDRFDTIVTKHGWTGWKGEGSKEGVAWRKKIIYDTNIRSALAAGRYEQLTNPKP